MKPFRQLINLVMVSGSLLSAASPTSASAGELLPPGFRPLPPDVHALVGGKIAIRPGEALLSGTIVIRDGLIQAVGRNVARSNS